MTTPATHSAPLDLLRRYRIVSPLGKGGMAEVFLAAWEVAPHAQRPVVIKRLYAHLGDDPNLVHMFLDEARLASGLEHENIVKTIEVGLMDGQCCIAMEYLAGQTLQSLLRHDCGPAGMPIPVVIFIALQVLNGLHYAHEAVDHRGAPLDIVHRDISPQNIFVTNNGRVKILDFGIAKANTHESRTATGYIKGKLAYIAPEQAAATQVDRRADLWSLGVVMWEMLTGQRLFRADSDAATLQATLTATIAPPSKYRHEVPAAIDRVVLKALQRSPHHRYPTARTMTQDIERYLARSATQLDQPALANLMGQLFHDEITTQRRQLYELLENGESFSMPKAAGAGGSSASSIALLTTSVQEPSLVNRALDHVTRHQKLVIRTLLGAFMALVGVAALVVYLLMMRLAQVPGRAQEPAPAAALERRARQAASVLPRAESTPVPSTAALAVVAPTMTVLPTQRSRRMAPPPAPPSKANPVDERSKPTDAHPAPIEYGFLSLDTTPWSQVSANGRLLGQTPLVGVKLPTGTHVLTLRNPDLEIETRYSVTIESGKTLARRIGLQ